MSITNRLRDHYRRTGQSIPFYLPQSQCRPEVLLCANTVKPMHCVVPREILGRAWWDKTRMAAYRSTQFHCIACGVHKRQAKEHKWLEGHELYETDYAKGRMVYIETVPLCHYCHSYIHDGRLRALLVKGEVSEEKISEILKHGNEVLALANLTRPKPYNGDMAEWGEWRLVLFGKEYPPKYSNYEEWCKAFGGNQGFDG